jgi:hypothetical protein
MRRPDEYGKTGTLSERRGAIDDMVFQQLM